MPNQILSRNSLRKHIRELRNALSAEEQETAKHALMQTLAQSSVFIRSKKVALYLTNDGELDTSQVIAYCWEKSIAVYLPVIHPFSKGHLLFLKYDRNTPMVTNRFGIKEPRLNVNSICLVHELDTIFTPLVAFDENGDRLGMGGGFYDRTLALGSHNNKLAPTLESSLNKNKRRFPLAIGIAHDCQKVEKVPTESWDAPISQVATPTKLYSF